MVLRSLSYSDSFAEPALFFTRRRARCLLPCMRPPSSRSSLDLKRSVRLRSLPASSFALGEAPDRSMPCRCTLPRASILSALAALSDCPPAIASCWSPPPRSQTPHREGVETSGGGPAWGALRLDATLASQNHGMFGSLVSTHLQQQPGVAKESPLARPAAR